MSLIYPNHVKILRPERLINRQRAQILEPQGSVWGLGFDGVDDYVEVQNSTSLNSITNKLTVVIQICNGVWPGGVDIDNLISRFGATDSVWVMDIRGTERIRWIVDTGTFGVIDFASGLDIIPTRQLVGTYDGAILRLYVDGAEVDTANHIGTIKVSTNSLFIGRRRNVDRAVTAAFEKVVVYNQVLTAIEIKNLYEQFLQPDDLPGLVGWWRFQEGFGLANGTRIRDWSGQGNHGEMQEFSGDPWVNIGVR